MEVVTDTTVVSLLWDAIDTTVVSLVFHTADTTVVCRPHDRAHNSKCATYSQRQTTIATFKSQCCNKNTHCRVLKI